MDAERIDYRAQRGLALAKAKGAAMKRVFDDRYVVPSQEGRGAYFVDLSAGSCRCTCKDFAAGQGRRCKHAWAVLIVEKREVVIDDGTFVVTEKRIYVQHPRYRQARRHEKEYVMGYASALCSMAPRRPYAGTGRPPASVGDVIFAGLTRGYTTMAQERAETDLRFAQREGLIRTVPSPSTIYDTLKKPEVVEIIRSLITVSALPLRAVELDWAPDGTGIATRRYLCWRELKWGSEHANETPKAKEARLRQAQQFLKLDMTVGTTSLIVVDPIVTRTEHESRHLPHQIATVGRNFLIRDVPCDQGYTSRRNQRAIVEAGGWPVMKFQDRHRGDGRDELWNRTHAEFVMRKSMWGRLWEERYNTRNKSETAFSAFKTVLGTEVRSTSYEGQVSEILLRVLAHNLRMLVLALFQLGVEVDFKSAPTAPVSRELQ